MIKHKLLFEKLFYPFAYVSSIYFSKLTKYPPQNLPKSYKLFEKYNWLPIRFHYYNPIIKKEMLSQNYDEIENPLHGIKWNDKEQLDLLNKFNFNSELEKISKNKENEILPYYDNMSIGPGDSEILYNMIRYHKPKRVIEIGAGESTKFIQLAIKKNKKESDVDTEHICIEPYGPSWLENLEINLIKKRVENLDISFFQKLNKNDVLFIDSSHVIRTQGDVIFEYLNIIPSLKKGVIIHSHDIFIPYDYPPNWILNNRLFWTEQYLLQALLTNSPHFEVLLPVNYLYKKHRAELERCCPILSKGNGGTGSFWFRIKQKST